ncbi:autotransporter outer membrane beta-barrel domain-containing protein [Enterobacteriaceae bacterium 89]|nr:autotransporter outer membrane beta-barrel domain-containing protein [Enterobacteriaceae bacterium 89]
MSSRLFFSSARLNSYLSFKLAFISLAAFGEYVYADTVVVPSRESALVLDYAEDYLIDKNSIIYSYEMNQDTLAVLIPVNHAEMSTTVNLINQGEIIHKNDENSAALCYVASGRLENQGIIKGWGWGLIYYGDRHSLLNQGVISAGQGSALTLLDNKINIDNSGSIEGEYFGVYALNAGVVNITNSGKINGVQNSGISLLLNSSVYNSGIISSQDSAAIVLSGENNAITLGTGSQLSGNNHVAILSQAPNNMLSLEGSNKDTGSFLADVPEHSLAKILSTETSDWTLSGKVSAWGSTPGVIEIAGRLALTGDVVVGGGGDTLVTETGNLMLGDGGSLTSAVTNFGTITVADSFSKQTSAQDFTINGDVFNAGMLQMSDGAQTYGHNLQINGNYKGDTGSVLIFNGKLEGDNSLVDKLTINGNVSGSTAVDVHNLGGSGAATVQGIELIRVNGASTADSFVQNKRIVSGSYDYFLHYGRDGEQNNNWYLTSTLIPSDTAVDVQPVVGRKKVEILRPESGAYAANSAISNRMFITTLDDRAAVTAQGSSLWLRQTGTHQTAQATDQLKDTGNQYVSQLGGELLQLAANEGGAWHIGAITGYGYSSGTTRSSVTGYRAQRSLQGYSAGLSATWFADEASHHGIYSDNWLIYSIFNNRVKGDELAGESWKSSGMTASTEWGYRAQQRLSEQTSLQLQPQMQIIWMDVNAKQHKEANGSKVTTDNGNVATRLGLRSAIASQAAGLNIQPFVELNWWHNSRAAGTIINGTTTEIAGMKNIAEIKSGIGVSVNTKTDISFEANLQNGQSNYANVGAALKAKIQF